MSSSASSQESGCCSPARYQQENLYHQTANISSNLQLIPYTKLTGLKFINKGAYGTVHKAFHADWRVPVAVKFFPKERHLVESDRNKIFKEADILHKARFSYILPILGICYEEENIGIVTEYMTNGSLNQLLHEENPSPEIVWPLRFRILYEIALGVNFLHNMTPPLLHHDLKTPNILLDSEFHVKIADFGLSKWRMLSQSFSDHTPAGGTIIYMPPEMYEPNINTGRGSVKHDMYSYAIIMWEVLSRKQPYEGATNPMQIMFSVAKGNRPDLTEESLPANMPHRDVFISLMQSGWACEPNDRPAFLKCLLDLEPLIRSYDDVSMLEGILHIKRARGNIPPDWRTSSNISVSHMLTVVKPNDEDIKPGFKNYLVIAASIFYHSTCPFRHSGDYFDRSQPPTYTQTTNPSSDTRVIGPQQETLGSAIMWVVCRRDQIVNQMTDACLNQCLDALISHMIIIKEDYELVRSERTRSAKVRRLIDTCEMQGELFAKIIVQKLKDNRQNDLKPFPEFVQDG
ncbi:PREDICTED: receptor-interacting serine/threonine-protein kinase 2 [Nanorana parkeri]|uniref:receptor-interacting serine/threonine-protein kinase 2 n=1 Tax=Nanorana parkeri TaxID=125878 RepID=UPI000854418C|nr:PREDICTED: receptor-interacting serine/threonine-protein kinase 2 [Nanorana parkeri]